MIGAYRLHEQLPKFVAFLEWLASEAKDATAAGAHTEALEWWDGIALIMLTWVQGNAEMLPIAWGDPMVIEPAYATLMSLLLFDDGPPEQRAVARRFCERVKADFPEVARDGEQQARSKGKRYIERSQAVMERDRN